MALLIMISFNVVIITVFVVARHTHQQQKLEHYA